MITVNVFFAYQFANSQFSKIQRERAYSDAMDAVNDELEAADSGIQLQWEYWDIQSGSGLSDEIFSRMDRSDLFVFDLSDANSNVYIELGYGIAQVRDQGKKMIVFVHSETGRRSLPTDISGMFVHSVNEKNIGMILASELVTKASVIAPFSRLVREFWNPNDLDLDIVCPTLPEERRSRHADHLEDNYLKYLSYADLDTLFYLQEKTREHFSRSKTANFHSEKYSDTESTTSMIVGGPVWNVVARNIQSSLPLRFVDGGDGNDDPVVEMQDGKEVFHTPNVSQSVLEHDISYFSRIDMNDGSYSFLISGCRTYGVLGAAKAFFESSVAAPNIELIQRLCGRHDFVVAFKSRVISNRVIPARFDTSTVLSLYRRTQSGDFERIEL